MITEPSSESDLEDLDFILQELDRAGSRLTVRLEMRRFRKPVTIVRGLRMTGRDLLEVGRRLKKQLAAGGTAKDGMILLQGDHRGRVKEELVSLGFSADTIEVR